MTTTVTSTRLRAAIDETSSAPARVPFDGVVCLGGVDWWYHNRGHYDVQMMLQLSATWPVLYVNSVGMRMPAPTEGRMFARRLRRKIASIGRGVVAVSETMSVLSPSVLPGPLGLALTRGRLLRAVRSAAADRGMTRPLVWVACPAAAGVVDGLAPAAVVYQRTDLYERFDGVNARRIAACDRRLKARADLTVFCSRHLYERERDHCRRACRVDHGVDFDRFVSAAALPEPAPPDMAALPRPRVGFIGGIDAHTFDPRLFLETAGRLPDVRFVLVGACSLPDGWCRGPNVTRLGRRPYEEIHRYMAACDVLIMPWRRSAWIEACCPVKLKEYLAVGRPVVSTGFPELRDYAGLVTVADGPAEFAAAIDAALRDPGAAGPRRERVRGHAWSVKAREVVEALTDAVAATPRRTRPARPGARLKAGPGRPARADVTTCIVLAGGLRPSPLVAETGRSVLDLWATAERSVLGGWLDRIGGLEDELERTLPVRVVHDGTLPAPWPVEHAGRPVSFEREPLPLRGPAGVLRDVSRALGEDEHLLVVEAARFPAVALCRLLREHRRRGADVTVAVHEDGTPAGACLVRCGALALVPELGFMDLKEQWLPKVVAAGARTAVARLPAPGLLPLRTRADLLAAARVVAAKDDDLRVICPGAVIGPEATVIDSIVMPGAVVGTGAVVVRALVCPDARVEPGRTVVDAAVRTPVSAAGRRASCA